MSLNALFSTARRSLLAHQAATNATASNVANVETPGYTRRTTRLQSDPASSGGILIPGRAHAGGVGVAEYDRVRLALLDDAARRGKTGAGGADEGARLLAGLEAQVAPDGGGALTGAVGSFFDAWADVADNPTDGGTRDALVAATDRLAGALAGAAGRAEAYGRAVERDLATSVDRANGLLQEVAALNETIRAARAQGADDLDALDRRDVALDELAGLAPFKARNEADGTVTVTVAGMVAVQDAEAAPLRLTTPPATPAPAVWAKGAPAPLALDGTEGGAIGAQLHLLGSALPDARAALDRLAADLVTGVNAQHRAGTGLDGLSGRDFFDPAGVTATSLALGADVLASTDAVAAAGPGQGPGDATTATAVVGLGEAAGGAATRLLADLGTEVRAASAASAANEAFAGYTQGLRDGVSRVSLDEEMADLIRHQQAFAASARVLQTAESLFDTILTI